MQLKPIAVITVLLLVSLSIAGCITTQNTTMRGIPSTKLGYIGVNVTQVPAPASIGSSSLFNTPEAGYRFVFFNATVTNINAAGSVGRGRTVSPDYFTLHDSNGYAYSVSPLVSDLHIAGFPPTIITHPGDKVSGLLPFEVPQNAKLVNLVYNDSPGSYGDFEGSVTVNL
jgi:predicted small secreted protein